MAGFNLDFENTFEGFAKIDDGIYEVVIDSAVEDATQSGSEFTNFQMTIRNDLDQPFKGQKIWERVWKTKATGKYNMMMFNTIGKAAGLQSGKTYNNFDELLDDYRGKPVQVFVKNEKSTGNDGKEYENLNVKQWKQTAFPNVQHQYKGKDQGGAPMNDAPNISENDLPF